MYAVLEDSYKTSNPPPGNVNFHLRLKLRHKMLNSTTLGFNVSEDYVLFKTNERFQRISLWINQVIF